MKGYGGIYEYKGRGRERDARVAQLVERSAVNRKVDGSNPSVSVILYFYSINIKSPTSIFMHKTVRVYQHQHEHTE